MTEMDWLLQLNGFATDDDRETNQLEVEGRTMDFSLRTQNSMTGVHLNYRSKPPFSYTHLITEAISSTANKRMSLSEIYQWIRDNYPYYRTAQPGWKVGPT